MKSYNWSTISFVTFLFSLAFQGFGQLVEAGKTSSFYICEDHSVWAFGENTDGILGDGTDTNRTNPVLIFYPEDSIVKISCGGGHAMALNASGEIYSWGNNFWGQLGNGTNLTNYTPELIFGISNVIDISAGEEHSMALTADGTVWTWGHNEYGRLGTGNYNDTNIPIALVLPHTFTQISAGGYHSLALTDDGQVYAWGRNYVGELGDNSTTNKWLPTPTLHNDSIVFISAGFTTSCAISSTNGKLLVWGNNALGQYGNGTTTNDSIPVYSFIDKILMADASKQHIMVLKLDSTVWGMGVGYPGTLGDGTGTNSNIPTQAFGLNGINDIAAGDFHSLAVNANLYGFGGSSFGVLGNGATSNIAQLTPYETNFGCMSELGVNNPILVEELSVYPNPSSGILKINGWNVMKEFVQMEISTNIGEIVLLIENFKEEIDVSNLANGFYLLRIKHNKGIETIPFVKQ